MSGTPTPSADAIFGQYRLATDSEAVFDDLVFAEAEALGNPLSTPLVAALRALRRANNREQSYRLALKQAIELLHAQQNEIDGYKRRERARLEQGRS